MRRLIVLKKIKTEAGFNLLEVLIVTVIIGIASAVSVPNLLGSQRDNEAKEAWTKIRGALVEAQTNANRMSTTCTINIVDGTDEYAISGTPAGCLLEPFVIDKSVASIESSKTSTPIFPLSISYDFEGDTSDQQTLVISRNDFSSPPNPLRETGRCLVIAPNLGMIRTGLYVGPSTGTFTSGNCNNNENEKYDSLNP